jgi:hypothetical protein
MFSSGEMMGVVYSVYNDDDMRAGTLPVFPFVYIVNFGTLFQVKHLPVIVVQVTIFSTPIEMGGDDVLDVFLDFHIFGRDSVQTANIKGAFRNIQSWPIYNFDGDNATIQEDCGIMDDKDGHSWGESGHTLNDNSLAIEASLAAWSTMSCYIQVTTL